LQTEIQQLVKNVDILGKDRKLHLLTRNIAKSGEVLIWSGFSPLQHYLGLIKNHSQSASCHIANVVCNAEIVLNIKIRAENANAQTAHLFFLPTHKPTLKKQKSCFFANDQNNCKLEDLKPNKINADISEISYKGLR
jgi:hypothetical protein